MAERGLKSELPKRVETGEFEGALHVGSKSENDVYWYVPKNILVEFDDTNSDLVPKNKYQLSQETVGEYIHRTARDGSVWSLNQLGEFLRNVASFRDVRILTVRQEEAYGLCCVSELDKPVAAELLGISEPLLDDHLSTAQKKITCAFNLVEAVNKN